MNTVEDCCKCQSMRRQLEELKQKHLLDFRTIKQKIVSTDELIKLYQKKCQEFDKQTKCVAELTAKLEGCQRNMDVMRLQLEKSLELNVPLKKACHDLENEKKLERIEKQKLQDKLRGYENLVSQFKNAVKEKEKSEEALRLDVTLQSQEIEEQKKSLKKNETQIKRLKEQILTEKKEKREINKQLTLSQKQVKRMEKRLEESKQAVTKLKEQLQQAKQAQVEFSKVHLLSPSPPKRSRRTRRKEEENKEENKDEEEKSREILLNEIFNILALSPCPTLSPLPSSPSSSGKEEEVDSDHGDEFGNDEPDCIDDGDSDMSSRGSGNVQIRDHFSGNENSLPEATVPQLNDFSFEAGISSIAGKTDTENYSKSKTNLDQPTTEGRASENAIIRNLNSKGKRKRERLYSESEPEQWEEESNVNVNECCGTETRDEFKTENTSHQNSSLAHETNLKKPRTEVEKNHINHELNFIDVDDNKTDSTNPCSSLKRDTISTFPESFEARWQRTTEDVELEVSLCLRNIVEVVASQESSTTSRGVTVAHSVSLDNKNLVDTVSPDDLLETTQRRAMCAEQEVFDCLNSLLETVVNSNNLTNSSASASDDILQIKTPGAERSEEITVCESSVVCSEFTIENDHVKTAVSLNLETAGENHKAPDATSGEAVRCLSILDQPHGKFDEDSKEADTVGCGVRLNEESISKQSSNTGFSREESSGSIVEELPVTDHLEKTANNLEDGFIESCGDESLAFLLEFSAPLTPIPDSPERPIQLAEIPSFDSWETLPSLSPLPPSPGGFSSTVDAEDAGDGKTKSDKLSQKESTVMVPLIHRVADTGLVERTENSLSEAEVCHQLSVYPKNSEETGEAQPLGKKKAKRKKTALSNSLNRSSEVNEHCYVLCLLTKLKKHEITIQEVVSRFSMITNLRASSPFVSALIEILKLTQDGEDDLLIEKFTELHDRVGGRICYKEWQPLIVEFEMRVIVVVWNLTKLKHFSGLLLCSLKLLGKTLLGLFRSENKDSAVLAMCRVYTAFCRLMGDGARVRVFCYDIVKENHRHLFTRKIILSVGLVWPEVLRQKDNCFSPGNSVVSGPLYQPFLSTLQTIVMSREISSHHEQSIRVFQLLCGWSEIKSGNKALELLAFDLARILQDSGYVTLEEKSDFGPSLGSGAFETVKSLELLASVLGWEWTNDILIRKLLWPVLQEWKLKELCRRRKVFDVSKCICVNEAEVTKQMLSQNNENVLCHSELEATDVVNSSIIDIVSKDAHKDERTLHFDPRMEVETTSEVAETRNDALNGVQKEQTTCNHTVQIDSRARDRYHETILGELKSEQNTKAAKISGCLSDMKLSTILRTASVNGNCDKALVNGQTNITDDVLPKTEERTVSQTSGVNTDPTNSTISKEAYLFGNKDARMHSDCGQSSKNNAMEATIVSILRLLGLLGLLGLQQEKEVSLDAVINLLCAVLTHCAGECNGVTFAIQLGAAYAAMDMLRANPAKIFKVLSDWIVRLEKKTEDVNLPPHFRRHVKYIRTHLTAKSS